MNKQPEKIEKFEYGIERHWFDDGHIAMISSQGDMSDSAIDMWANTLHNTRDTWSLSTPHAIIVDLTHPNQGITPLARQRARDLAEAMPKDTMTFVSVLLPKTFVNQIFRVFLRNPMFNRPHLRLRIHNNRDEALAWLREMLDNSA